MKPVMKVYVTKGTKNDTFEGFVTMPNLEVTRLRKENGSTNYKTLSNLKQAAVAAARKFNSTLVFVTPSTKIAAKKSAK
jgi:hypothetical protein